MNLDKFSEALEIVIAQCHPSGPRYILVGPKAAKILLRYRRKPNFCVRPFKRRSKRK